MTPAANHRAALVGLISLRSNQKH